MSIYHHSRYLNNMKEGTSIHVLQQGEPQTCIPRKAEELTFEYKSL